MTGKGSRAAVTMPARARTVCSQLPARRRSAANKRGMHLVATGSYRLHGSINAALGLRPCGSALVPGAPESYRNFNNISVSSFIRAGARPCFGSWRKGGQNAQALGRSRGGFSTKIHLKVDLDGLPLAFHLTGGEASDSRNFEILLDLGPDIAPRAAITDKGYDAKANRDGARRRGICPVMRRSQRRRVTWTRMKTIADRSCQSHAFCIRGLRSGSSSLSKVGARCVSSARRDRSVRGGKE